MKTAASLYTWQGPARFYRVIGSFSGDRSEFTFSLGDAKPKLTVWKPAKKKPVRMKHPKTYIYKLRFTWGRGNWILDVKYKHRLKLIYNRKFGLATLKDKGKWKLKWRQERVIVWREWLKRYISWEDTLAIKRKNLERQLRKKRWALENLRRKNRKKKTSGTQFQTGIYTKVIYHNFHASYVSSFKLKILKVVGEYTGWAPENSYYRFIEVEEEITFPPLQLNAFSLYRVPVTYAVEYLKGWKNNKRNIVVPKLNAADFYSIDATGFIDDEINLFPVVPLEQVVESVAAELPLIQDVIDEFSPLKQGGWEHLVPRVFDKYRNNESHLDITLAESHHAYTMLCDSIIKLSRALLQVRRGRFDKAALILTGSSVTKTGKVASNWLELQYGWLPLLADIHDTFNLFTKGTKGKFEVISVGSSRKFKFRAVPFRPRLESSLSPRLTTPIGYIPGQTIDMIQQNHVSELATDNQYLDAPIAMTYSDLGLYIENLDAFEINQALLEEDPSNSDLAQEAYTISNRLNAFYVERFSRRPLVRGTLDLVEVTLHKNLYFHPDTQLSSTEVAGGIDPLSVSWNLLPYSFVFDWFAPIGDYLEALNATKILSNKGSFWGSYSVGIEIFGYTHSNELKYPKFFFNGQKNYRYDKLPIISESLELPPMNLKLNLTRCLNALALFHQARPR